MKGRTLPAALSVGVLALLLLQAPAGFGATTARAFDISKANTIQKRILSGVVDLESKQGPGAEAATAAPTATFSEASGGEGGGLGCSMRLGSNVKVNQNCLNLSDSNLQGRAQAQNETAIAQDPNRPNHLVATYNDYRRGDGTCGVSYSRDGGHNWADATTPNGFTRGGPFGAARQYWQAGGDTSVAFDTKGNAYLSCQVFMRGAPTSSNRDLSSAFYVYRSTGTGGASWNFPGRPVRESPDVAGTGLQPFEDKQYLTVDNHPGSPFQDRVYVTWTEFSADGSAYIWEANSNDYGESFSKPVLVSGNNTTLCTNTFSTPTPQGNCNENQFSDPFTAPDGSLYVTWANYNNPTSGPSDNHNQMLLARSTDGGASFSLPVKVADYYDLPDCPTYQDGQDPGRACVPEKGSAKNSVFRAANYPSGQVNPGNNKQVVVTFGSYINQHSKEANGCVPAGLAADLNNLYTGVKTAGACNNDILVSVSNNAGTSFTGTTTDPRALTSATGDGAQKTTDQWFQWSSFTDNGTLAVSYYDRKYGNDESNGNSDISLSASQDLNGFEVKRVTSSSMPLPTQFTNAKGNGIFWGDYAGLSAGGDAVHPVWGDTRNVDLFLCPGTGTPGNPPKTCTMTTASGLKANDQEIYTAAVSLDDEGN
jgi:hypothetical protein